MHIFLVNDDGIGSIGIMALARAAVAKGHKVSMCAPASQQSAASQRITLTEPLYVSDFDAKDENITAYAIKGTPADCVRLGLFDLITEPVDILISGINDGYNAGTAVYYSGTVGAAREGSMHHLHAIAASINYHAASEMVEYFAGYVMAVAEKYVLQKVPPLTVLNINAPRLPFEELQPPVYAPLSTGLFLDSYLRRESPRAGLYFWLEGGARSETPQEGTDQDMLDKGHITLTLMGNLQDCRIELPEFWDEN